MAAIAELAMLDQLTQLGEVPVDLFRLPVDAARGGRFDAEALAFQVQPFARETQARGGFFHPAAALLERVLQHRAFEMLWSRREQFGAAAVAFAGAHAPSRQAERIDAAADMLHALAPS